MIIGLAADYIEMPKFAGKSWDFSYSYSLPCLLSGVPCGSWASRRLQSRLSIEFITNIPAVNSRRW